MTSDGRGGLELYTSADGAWRRYTLQGKDWHRRRPAIWRIFRLPTASMWILGEDGNRYAIYPEPSDYRFRLFRITQEGESSELLAEVLSRKKENGRYRYFPDYLAVSAEGNILLSGQNSTEVFTPDGKFLFEMPQEWSSMEGSRPRT